MKILFIYTFFYFFLNKAEAQAIFKDSINLPVISNLLVFKNTTLSDSNNKMVAVCKYLNPCLTDIKYSTNKNFTKIKLYEKPMVFLRLPAAKAIKKVNEELKGKGMAIKVFDGYRPYSVTVLMWQIVPDERYTANPAKGSGHNKGIAIDLTLIDLKTGQEVLMPTAYDDFTDKAHHNFMGLPKEAIANRQILRKLMEKHGFVAFETEWWHYSLPNPEKYAVLNLSFESLKKLDK